MHRRRKGSYFVLEVEQPKIETINPNYQPNETGLEKDTQLSVTFEQAVRILTRPVHVKYVDRS